MTWYVVNRAARSLVTQRTGSVAMVLSEPHEKLFEDPNYSTLIRVAIRMLAERDMSLVMMLAGDEGDRERVVRYVRGGHADGVLLVSTHAGDPLVDALVSGPPAVSCGAVIGHENVIPYAAADERLGARQMTEYFVRQRPQGIGTTKASVSRSTTTCSAAWSATRRLPAGGRRPTDPSRR
ncbi:LacI family DNA-binding transcriptional regulator [Nonomuraea basaltis]|uniref:LacI family DNA-binding transcriptional regulator n=1 Tax=Nonomuraea basaltis TaxID=2495887 RepID=UPI00197D30C7|nr:LacI family DNA-binding transcriptional regulator [Nonomuraea basaltis]